METSSDQRLQQLHRSKRNDSNIVGTKDVGEEHEHRFLLDAVGESFYHMYTVSELCLCQCIYICNVYQCQVYKYIQSNNQNKTCQKSIKNEDTTNTCNLSKPRIDRWLHHHRALEVMAPWIRNEQFKQATWQHGNGNKKHMVTVLFWGKTHTFPRELGGNVQKSFVGNE